MAKTVKQLIANRPDIQQCLKATQNMYCLRSARLWPHAAGSKAYLGDGSNACIFRPDNTYRPESVMANVVCKGPDSVVIGGIGTIAIEVRLDTGKCRNSIIVHFWA